MTYKPAAPVPHPLLAPLLAKYRLTHAQFVARGRPPVDAPPHLHEARRAIVTELHEGGLTWAQLIEVTGLSNGTIQRLTGAKGCAEARRHRSENGTRTGQLWKGKQRPGQLERQWAAGAFDFHRGRVHSPAEIERQRAAYTPEVRARMSQKKVEFLERNPGWTSFKYSRTEEWDTVKGGPVQGALLV